MAVTKKFLDFTGLTQYDSKIKAYIADQIGGAGKLTYSVVEALPAVAEADAYTIYLVSRSAGQKTTDVYDEFLLINGAFEMIGNTEVDFSNYYTKSEINTTVNTLKGNAQSTADEESIAGAKAYADSIVSGKNVSASGETGDNALISASASNNAVTVASTAKLQGAVTKAENSIQSVAKGTSTENKVSLSVSTDSSKNVSITIDDSALKTWIDKIDGDNTTAGSIAKAAKDTLDSAKSYADGKITGLTETSKTGSGTYVSATVITEQGQVKSVSITDTIQAISTADTTHKGIAEASDVKNYVDTQVGGKNVSASGEEGATALITASASNNAVTVASTTKLQDAVSAAETAVQDVKVKIGTGTATTIVTSKVAELTVAEGTTNGTIKIAGSDVTVHGLDTAAYTTVTSLNSTAQGYANAVLGTNADTKDSVTVYGARAYAADLVSTLNPVDAITTTEINSLFS